MVAKTFDVMILGASDASAMNFGTDRKKPWKDIWGCGQGIGAIDEVLPTAALVSRLQHEYRAARERLNLRLEVSACT